MTRAELCDVVLAPGVRAREALEDGDHDVAASILTRLEEDVASLVERGERRAPAEPVRA